jgi:hypothetical protein
MLHPIHQIRRGDHPVRLRLWDRVVGSPSPGQGVRPPIPLGKPRASASSHSRWALIQQTSETPCLHASAALAHRSLCAKFGTEPAVR